MALEWFAKGLRAARQQIAYLNNYALLLSAQGCQQAATALLEEALRLAPGHANLLDSQRQISQQQIRQQLKTMHAGRDPAVQCPSLPR